MSEKVKQIAALLLLALLPAYFIVQTELLGFVGDSTDAQRAGDAPYLDNIVREYFPLSHELKQIGLDIRLWGGEREQNGIFISDKGLMRNIDHAIEPFVNQNIAEVAIFGQRLSASSSGKKTTYLAILPTSAGVLQQNLPRYAQAGMLDQQRQIEQIYNRLSTVVRTTDIYSALYNRRDQYIYYRTDNNLTALGGYYVYAAIAGRMEISGRSLGQFDIDYIDHAYYGDLYRKPSSMVGSWGKSTAPYRMVQPDSLSVFRFSDNREYTVAKRGGDGDRVYHTLFPTHLLQLDRPMDIYLGGSTAITEIRSTAPYRPRLLIFGDSTAAAWLPFLANHYQQITFVDFNYIRRSDYAAIQPEQYDQVLFAYGIETFIHTSLPSLAGSVVWNDDAH